MAHEFLAGDRLVGLQVSPGRLHPHGIRDRGDGPLLRHIPARPASGEKAPCRARADPRRPGKAARSYRPANSGWNRGYEARRRARASPRRTPNSYLVSTRMRPERAANSWPRRKRAKASRSDLEPELRRRGPRQTISRAGDGPVMAVLLLGRGRDEGNGKRSSRERPRAARCPKRACRRGSPAMRSPTR